MKDESPEEVSVKGEVSNKKTDNDITSKDNE